MSGTGKTLAGWAPAVLALAAGVGACGGSGDLTGPPEPIEELPRALSPAERELSAAGNDFAFRLLARAEASEPDANVFLSPLSASMALGMALVGADGGTFEAMRSTLGYPGLAREEIGTGYRDLIGLLLELDPSVQVGIGNSVWIREGFPVRPEYLEEVREWFDGEAAELDFSDPSAADVMNDWVADVTEGRIEQLIVPPIPGNVVAYLINAIYFKGQWTEPFDPEATVDAPFTRPDGGATTVRMMSRRGDVSYGSTDRFEVVELPYGGQAFAMTLLLPREGEPVESLAATLDTTAWRSLLASLSEREVVVSLPRFQLEYEKVLNDALQAMGMEVAFTGAADFSRMVEGGGVWIDEVKQKSFVRVDEEGTEAAAATSVSVVESAPPEIRFDRPFLVAIRERLTGTILFLGKITDPPAIPAG